MTRRCLLHRDELRHGTRVRISAAVLAGRKTCYLVAERDRFPFAKEIAFCPAGPIAVEYCPTCRAAHRAWLRESELRGVLKLLVAADTRRRDDRKVRSTASKRS